MKKNNPTSKTAGKVILSFFFAAAFLIGVTGLTYYTLNRLLDTMSELAQPNQRLNILNELQSEIIQITQIDQLGPNGDFRVQDSTIISLEAKLDELAYLAADSVEETYIKSIRSNVATLINGYIDLYDVKSNLANRNFTQEALRKVELGIRRRAQNVELQPLQRLNPRDFIFNELEQQNESRKGDLGIRRRAENLELSPFQRNNYGYDGLEQANGQRQEPQISRATREEDKLITYLRDLQQQNDRMTPGSKPRNLDSVLYNIRGVINQINREESFQRQKLARMESDLSLNQSAIIGTIQNLVGTLQRRALEESDRQNESAYLLAYDVTFFLILVVLIAVLGSAFMVYSILKEIKLNKQYQENLELSRQKSEQLARSKQEFLANMSHEIRNPLHVIQGYRSVLEKSTLEPGQKSHLRMIGFASDTLMEIVDEVLDFSKLEAGKLKLESHPFDPESLFGSIQNFFDLQASEKKLDFEWRLELPDGEWLEGDQLRLKQVLNNLLSNAFKFTSQGSITVDIVWKMDTLNVEIKDTGIGMSPEVLEKVFMEFDQADTSISRKYGGTGLGLAIVQRLVNLMNGEITATSTAGEGTTMKVQLPMESVPAQMSIVDTEEIETLSLSGKKIMLVDDDRVGLRYLETILSYYGATIISYPGGVSFRDGFAEEDFDLAILDIQMPEYSGFDVVRALRSNPRYNSLPILAMTANVFVEEKEKMMASGFNEILFKPFQEKTLVKRLGGFFPESILNKNTGITLVTTQENELFQLTDLRRFCMGDEQLLRDIVRDLIRETRDDMQRLKRARLNDQYDEILEICHQLGSRMGQIKSPASDLARKVEKSLKLGVRNGLNGILNQFDAQVSELMDALTESIYSPEKIEE